MRYAFFFTTKANVFHVFWVFFINMEAHAFVFCYVFSDFISFGPKL